MSGLYIHIPFCHSKCAYCDFYSTPKTTTAAAYIDSVVTEWQLRKSEFRDPVSTLYVGGGTPSILPLDLIAKLAAIIDPSKLKEATIEANPEDVSGQWIDDVARLGFNRVSMGVQSFDDEQLAMIGRRHSGVQAMAAARIAVGSGLRFNLDLIYGLPGQTLDSWKRNLDIAMELSPGHLSAYLLSYEPRTRLWAMRESGKVEEAGEDLVMQMYDHLIATTRENGYNHYEISNFARPGDEAIHNTNYWIGEAYLGLGAAAHSFDGSTRRYNPASVMTYVKSLSEGKCVFITEDEDQIDRINDLIITRLRTSTGLALEELESDFDPRLSSCVAESVSRLLAEGLLETTANGNIAIPERLWLSSDAIMRELIVAH